MEKCVFSLFLLYLLGMVSCFHAQEREAESTENPEAEIVVKRRDDGTRSSVNQVDEEGRVHGVRVTYYPDGKSIYSKNTYNHGKKEGPSIRYYHNGQVFEHNNFKDGKKQGPDLKYYKDGSLLSECVFEKGIVLPGLKEYDTDGTLIISYPEIHFREIDLLASRSRLDLEIYCPDKNRGIRYFLLDRGQGESGRTYLISEKSSAIMQFYVKPGEILDRQIELIAEIPTDLGNIMARKLSYHVKVTN
jgi:hypothetical protein